MLAVQPKDGPKAIGPYSQAIVVPASTKLVFTSGQIPFDPKTGELVSADIKTETNRVLDNLLAVLRSAHSDFSKVIKTTIYLTNLADYSEVNETYALRFSGTPPARSTVQVAALPKGARVEIEMIAIAE